MQLYFQGVFHIHPIGVIRVLYNSLEIYGFSLFHSSVLGFIWAGLREKVPYPRLGYSRISQLTALT